MKRDEEIKEEETKEMNKGRLEETTRARRVESKVENVFIRLHKSLAIRLTCIDPPSSVSFLRATRLARIVNKRVRIIRSRSSMITCVLLPSNCMNRIFASSSPFFSSPLSIRFNRIYLFMGGTSWLNLVRPRLRSTFCLRYFRNTASRSSCIGIFVFLG